MAIKANVNVTLDLDEASVREIIAEWVTRNYGSTTPTDVTFNIGQRTEGNQFDSYTTSFLKGVTCKPQGRPVTNTTYRGLGDGEFGSK